MKHWLYLEFWWSVHNIIAHPLSQFLWWGSLCGKWRTVADFAEFVHDWTLPEHEHEASASGSAPHDD